MPAPLTANDVVLQLAGLARDLDHTVQQLEEADAAAVLARHEADLGLSRAFLSAPGSVEHRKHLAAVACEHLEREARLAEAVVRHLRRRIDALKVRVEVGRSYGAAIRSEMSLASAGGAP